MKPRLSAILVLILSLAFCASAAEPNPNASKGAWFATGTYSLDIANNGFTYSRIGAMGGYLGNWGGYAKIAFDLVGNNKTPSFGAGFTKRLGSFQVDKKPSAIYMYFGLGYANVEHADEWFGYDHTTLPDGTLQLVPSSERKHVDWDRTAGMLVDAGLIYRYRHINVNLGYSLSADVFGGIYGEGNSANHSIQIGVGYTF